MDTGHGEPQPPAEGNDSFPSRRILAPAIQMTEKLRADDNPAESLPHGARKQRLGAAHGTITVLCSHRFSSVHMADQIIVMDGVHHVFET